MNTSVLFVQLIRIQEALYTADLPRNMLFMENAGRKILKIQEPDKFKLKHKKQ